MIKVVHIITGLDTGGAEMMLSKLVSAMDRKRFELEVISLTDIGPVGEKIKALNIPVHAANMRRGMPSPDGLVRLTGLLKTLRPQTVQTWMYHADLLGGLAAKMAKVPAIAWNIRNSTLDPKTSKRTTIATVRLCARLSRRLPHRIVCCSEAAKDLHISLGYDAGKMRVIPNGFDLTAFRPDAAARREVRQELDIPDEAPIIGLVGRYDPQKDHANFVQAAALLHARLPSVYFVLCGDRVTWENGELAAHIKQAGLKSQFRLLGRRSDIPRLNAAFDLAASSSAYGEAFPNVLGEAMACGTPCTATDVGDSALIIGATGRSVPPRDPQALSDAWMELLNMEEEARRRLGGEARCRVQENFSLPLIAARYQETYEELAKPCAV